jgi:hypothetical protein
MKKVALSVLGGLLILFGIAQVLQLAGLIGTKTFSLPGVAFAVLGLALGTGCFKKAFAKKST